MGYTVTDQALLIIIHGILDSGNSAEIRMEGDKISICEQDENHVMSLEYKI